MKAITLRGVDPDLAEKIKISAKDHGKSINQMTLDLIRESLGLSKKKQYSHHYTDLDNLFGRWTDEEYQSITQKIIDGRQIDPGLWK